jgi:hypothetical protein
MIIRQDDASLVLITQPEHAALARRMMTHWQTRVLAANPRLDSILHAIAEHDNGWREVDAAPLVGEDGRLLDFVTAPVDVRQGLWPRAVRRLAADPIAAALVAEHALYIYRRYADDEAWRSFFTEMEILRDELAAGAGMSPSELARDYFFLRIADLMSLVFCNGWTEAQELDDHVVVLVDQTVVVRPDPFGGREIAISAPARVLPDRAYRSGDDAREEYARAPHARLEGLIRGA